MHSEVELDLEDFSRKCTDIQFRSQPHKDKILKILQILREKFDPELSDTDLDLVLNSLRCLRNVVAGVEQNQTFLGQNIFGNDSENTLQNLLKSSGKQSDKRLLVPRLALQVTANCIVDHKENQHLLVNCDSLVSSLKYTLETCEDEKSQYFVTLILLTILKNCEADRTQDDVVHNGGRAGALVGCDPTMILHYCTMVHHFSPYYISGCYSVRVNDYSRVSRHQSFC